MRTLSALVCLTLLSISAQAQSGGCTNPFFQFDFQGSGKNVSVTCGKILNSAIWKVTNDTCIMTTDTIYLSQSSCSGPNNMIEVNITMDREGNQVDHDDYIINNIFVSGILTVTDTIGGDWVPESGNSNVRTMSYQVAASYPDFMIIEIEMGTNDPQASLKILSGGSCQNCYTPSFLLPIDMSPLQGYVDASGFSHLELSYSHAWDQLEDFWLEKSIDGHQFYRTPYTTLAWTDGTVEVQENKRLQGTAYYRIAALSDAGDTTYSTLVSLTAQASNLFVYPNPAQAGQSFNILFDGDIQSLFLINTHGAFTCDYSAWVQKKGSGPLPLPSSISSGIYWLVLQSGDQIFRSQLIIP